MREVLSGILGDVVALVASAVGTVVFTLGGFTVEQAGIHNVIAGSMTVGLWETYMGTILMFVGMYLFGYDQCWRRVRRYLSNSTVT